MLSINSDDLKNLSSGPVVIIHAWITAYIEDIVDHHRALGFDNFVICTAPNSRVAVDGALTIECSEDVADPANSYRLLNALIPHFDGQWVLFIGASDFLYFPFSKSRTVKDLVTFMEDERRDSLHGLIIDLFPSRTPKKGTYPKLESAHFDREGYFRERVSQSLDMSERLLKIFGGLRARLSDYLPENLHHANQVTFFKAHKGLHISEGMRFDDPEFNAIGCPWHHNASVAVASFDIFLRLKLLENGPTAASFPWAGSHPFNGSDTQLMEMGFMEPGQWF